MQQVTDLQEYKVENVAAVQGGVQAVVAKDEFKRLVDDANSTNGRVLVNDVHYDFNYYIVIDDSNDDAWRVEMYMTKAHI